jgi:cation:H+ antiporter
MIEYIMLIIGLFLLVKGADYLIDGSSSLAHKYGVSSLFIGLTVLAFGTSLPELVVNIIAAFKNSGEIAFGNIIGSNMSNILLGLGISSLIITLKISKSTIKKEIPFSIIAVLLLIIFSEVFLLFGHGIDRLSKFEGLILISGFVYFMYYVVKMAKSDMKVAENFKADVKKNSNLKIWIMIIGGLVALYLGGQWTVNNAIIVAKNFGMSEFFISATIIAIGTSLPEIITCIMAALKKDLDMVAGNIIGSNIFNILWILGITALITPVAIPTKLILDLVILLFVSLLLFFFVYRSKQINKTHGIIFILLYILYIVFLFYRG